MCEYVSSATRFHGHDKSQRVARYFRARAEAVDLGNFKVKSPSIKRNHSQLTNDPNLESPQHHRQ